MSLEAKPGRSFDRKVKYLSQQERQAFKITVGANGRIYDAQGKPVDTRGSVTPGDQAKVEKSGRICSARL